MSSHHKKKAILTHHSQQDNARARRQQVAADRLFNFEYRRQYAQSEVATWLLIQAAIAVAWFLGVSSWAVDLIRMVFDGL
jgi:hypothetical protein